ncbi:MAG: alpha/beta fold hydrolase [Deltaproteobacteria bacterium]|jgi:surfactin synthase thioesterase subunit|nr:alpha/beta fold hydrolase [Deltaproteobacteria bacterium]
MNIFFLAHAGGTAKIYSHTFTELLKGCRVTALELPGHGGRLDEPLLDKLGDMVDDLFAQMNEFGYLSDDYVLFGHSMGGLLAYLLAAKIPKVQQPRHIFLSSTLKPGLLPVGPEILDLGDEEFWRTCQDCFGAVNPEAAGSMEMILLFAPILRADLAAVICQNYDPWPQLDLPATVFFAEKDIVSGLDMAGWQAYFTRPLEIYRLPGNHFHILTDPKILADRILATVADLSGKPEASVVSDSFKKL